MDWLQKECLILISTDQELKNNYKNNFNDEYFFLGEECFLLQIAIVANQISMF